MPARPVPPAAILGGVGPLLRRRGGAPVLEARLPIPGPAGVGEAGADVVDVAAAPGRASEGGAVVVPVARTPGAEAGAPAAAETAVRVAVALRSDPTMAASVRSAGAPSGTSAAASPVVAAPRPLREDCPRVFARTERTDNTPHKEHEAEPRPRTRVPSITIFLIGDGPVRTREMCCVVCCERTQHKHHTTHHTTNAPAERFCGR